MSARLLSINPEDDSLAIESFKRVKKYRKHTKLVSFGVLQILLAKYCEAKALDLGNRLMALHRTETMPKRAIRIGACGRRKRKKGGEQKLVALYFVPR